MPTYRFRVVSDNRNRVLRELRNVVERTLNEIGESAARHASDNAPVDTGRLRDSYMYNVDMNTWSVHVGSPLPWSAYVELGTGPNYEQPPDWVRNIAERGHHTVDPWWYQDEYTGEWTLGWFVRSQPHLRPAFLDNVNEYIRIFRHNLQNP